VETGRLETLPLGSIPLTIKNYECDLMSRKLEEEVFDPQQQLSTAVFEQNAKINALLNKILKIQEIVERNTELIKQVAENNRKLGYFLKGRGRDILSGLPPEIKEKLEYTKNLDGSEIVRVKGWLQTGWQDANTKLKQEGFRWVSSKGGQKGYWTR